MKYLVSLLVLALCPACASRKPPAKPTSPAVSGTVIPAKRLTALRTPEVVKSYSVGRYADPNAPDTLHERHTIYRREEGPDWNFLPDPPVDLPESAGSNCRPSVADSAARQRIYAEALQEQNRAMQKRLNALQQEAGRLPALEQEIDRLKNELRPSPAPAPPANPPEPKGEEENDLFSAVDPELPVDDESTAEAISPDHAFLLAQMRLNDQFAAELAQAERRQRAALVAAPLLRRRELAFLNPPTP